MDLLGDSDVEEDEKQAAEINTDNSYATSYDTWRQKEHIQKLKENSYALFSRSTNTSFFHVGVYKIP